MPYVKKGEEPVMVVLTDGWGNRSISKNRRFSLDTAYCAKALGEEPRIRKVVVDVEEDPSLRYSRALRLAQWMGATYMDIEDLNAESLATSVRNVVEEIGQ